MTVKEFMDWFADSGLNPEITEIYFEDISGDTVELEVAFYDSGNVVFSDKNIPDILHST